MERRQRARAADVHKVLDQDTPITNPKPLLHCEQTHPTSHLICRDGPYAHALAGVELSNEPNLFLMNYGHELSAQLLGEDMCRCGV